jgi:uncharacterized repeat protein (TIGR01451 family)
VVRSLATALAVVVAATSSAMAHGRLTEIDAADIASIQSVGATSNESVVGAPPGPVSMVPIVPSTVPTVARVHATSAKPSDPPDGDPDDDLSETTNTEDGPGLARSLASVDSPGWTVRPASQTLTHPWPAEAAAKTRPGSILVEAMANPAGTTTRDMGGMDAPPDIAVADGPVASSARGERLFPSPTFPLLEADTDRYFVDNQSNAPAAAPISDRSGWMVNDGDVSGGMVVRVAAIEGVPTADDGAVATGAGPGDLLRYRLAVANAGDVGRIGDPEAGTLRGMAPIIKPIPVLAPGTTAGLSIAKHTSHETVRRGGTVPYTITISNAGASEIGPVDLRDRLPDGFLYVDGSARVDGGAVAVDVGRNATEVTWRGLVIPAGGEVVATLDARILHGTPMGEHVNSARMFDPVTGAPLLDAATAIVRILPEAVFDCGEVIGKVFDDRNGDGHQAAAGADRGRDDQSHAGAEDGDAVDAPEGEPGLPSIRLVTVDGLVITTDEYGRFSVPCAALPRDRGSNFLLKLDARSLPPGYGVTTENPRAARLTPGTMTEMNFGATMGRVVRVDLGPAAFETGAGGGATLSPALDAGLARLVQRIDGRPVNLRLAYHVGAGAGPKEVRAARNRIEIVERRLARLWRAAGFGPLRVEPVVVRPGQ